MYASSLSIDDGSVVLPLLSKPETMATWGKSSEGLVGWNINDSVLSAAG